MQTVIQLTLLAILASAPAAAAEEPKSSYSCSYELEECLDWMAEHYLSRGWAGVILDDADYVITEIFPDSPAARSDARVGDKLVAINGVEISEENQKKLVAIQAEMKSGSKVTYTLKRKGKRRNVEFTLVEMPFDVAAQNVGMHLLRGHTDLEFDDGD